MSFEIDKNSAPSNNLPNPQIAHSLDKIAVVVNDEDWVNHCIIALKSVVSGKTKAQGIHHLRQVIPEHGLDIERVKLLISQLHTLSLEGQKVESKCVKAFALQLFERNPKETCQGLLEHKFPASLHIELVKVIAKSQSEINSGWVTDHMALLGLEDEKDRIALAKIAAQSLLPSNARVNFMQRMELTAKYKITSEFAIVDVAKIIIRNDIRTASYLGRLKNIGEKHLTELIKYSVHCGPPSIFVVPKKIIKDKHLLLDIFLTCVKEATFPPQVFSWIDFPEDKQSLKKCFQLIMGPEMSLMERKPYFIPVNDVINAIHQFSAENKLSDLNLDFVNKLLEDNDLSQLEIKISLSTLVWTLELMFQKLNHEQSSWIIKHKLLEKILAYRDPSMRYRLSESIIQVAFSSDCRSSYEKLKSVKHAELANLLLAEMEEQGVSVSETAKKIASQRALREAGNKKLLIETLMCIRDCNKLSLLDKSNLMSCIFKKSSEIHSNMYRALAVLELGQAPFLKESTLTTIAEAEKLAQMQMFHSLFNMEVSLLGLQKYEELFSRNPSALFIYAAKLQNLPEGTLYKHPLIQCLKQYIESVLDGKFEEVRYEKVKNKHLQTVFPEQARPLFEAWKKGYSEPLDKFLSSDPEKKHFPGLSVDFEEVMLNNLNYLRDLPYIDYVSRFLNAKPGEERSSINIELTRAVKQIKIQLKKTSTTIEASQLQHLLFAQLLIDLARQKISFPNQSIENIDELKKIEVEYRKKTKEILTKIDKICEWAKVICPKNEFSTHIEELYRGIAKGVKVGSYENWTITDTDNPQDLALCGTEVNGSCQRVNGHIEYNKCLLAYLLDGKDRLLAIKDEKGKIRLRAILRILWDEKKTKPALFMEKIYPEVVQLELAEVLRKFAIERAKALNLPLLTKKLQEKSYPSYSGSIRSLGGPAPFEYVDVLKGVQKESIFEIKDLAIMYMPNSNSS